jgi:hypothetical protein
VRSSGILISRAVSDRGVLNALSALLNAWGVLNERSVLIMLDAQSVLNMLSVEQTEGVNCAEGARKLQSNSYEYEL